ncbi:MAG: diphthine synthase [Candidatus Micrarchaeaceae archaeon]
MLFLIGLGLGPGEISINGVSTIKKCKKIFIENYTTPISEEYIFFLKSLTKKITFLERKDMEDYAKKLVSNAKEENVAILIPGDPLIATTHHLLFIIAKNLSIPIKVLHSSSVFSAAVAESRLDIYKFGPTTTLSNWSEKYKPTSFLEKIQQNIKNNQHTLLLFDIINNGERTLYPKEALSIIEKAEEKIEKKVLSNKEVILLGNLGCDNQLIFYGTLQKITEINTSGLNKFCMVIPGKISFAEAELLELIKK